MEASRVGAGSSVESVMDKAGGPSSSHQRGDEASSLDDAVGKLLQGMRV